MSPAADMRQEGVICRAAVESAVVSQREREGRDVDSHDLGCRARDQPVHGTQRFAAERFQLVRRG